MLKAMKMIEVVEEEGVACLLFVAKKTPLLL